MRMTLVFAVAALMLPLNAPRSSTAPARSCDQALVVAHAQQDVAVSTELPDTDARKSCGHGIKSCSPNQVGQPCNPNNPNIICSAQGNGTYCCLAYAP